MGDEQDRKSGETVSGFRREVPFLKRIFCAVLSLLLLSLPLAACARAEKEAPSSPEITGSLVGDDSGEAAANAARVSEDGRWIRAVTPGDSSTADSESNITILFRNDMDEKTLTPSNIIIQDAKYSRNLSGLFDFVYDPDKKLLDIRFKIPGNSYGTGNDILVYLKRNIRTKSGEPLGRDYYFTFATE